MFRNYADYYDLFNSDKPYKKEIGFVYKWANKPKFIFDIGCGTASYWKYYPEDVSIIGLDKSRQMGRKNDHIIFADVEKYKHNSEFDCATALFDVINYIPRHEWWANIPVKKGGYFIFDCWDKKKVDREGFEYTLNQKGSAFREIRPINYDGKKVSLSIEVWDSMTHFTEVHEMYVHSRKEIEGFAKNLFEIVKIIPTKKWQTWYKLKRK